MEVLKTNRKIKCKECLNSAKFKLEFNKLNVVLCEDCVKELNKHLSRLTTPAAVATKFYKKR